ncbi:MAG: DUF5615 family PIN-like protein [Thermoleophilaceae bacterium]
MRLLLDAHVSGPRVGARLTADGHDVRPADQERELEGYSHEMLLALSTSEDRVLVTTAVGDFARIAQRWAAEARSHTGPILLVGMGHSEFGTILEALGRALPSVRIRRRGTTASRSPGARTDTASSPDDFGRRRTRVSPRALPVRQAPPRQAARPSGCWHVSPRRHRWTRTPPARCASTAGRVTSTSDLLGGTTGRRRLGVRPRRPTGRSTTLDPADWRTTASTRAGRSCSRRSTRVGTPRR